MQPEHTAASPKQRALLNYLGHHDPENISAEEASAYISEFTQREEGWEIMRQWSIDRMHLHPDLYWDELTKMREGRAAAICSHCNQWKEEMSFLDPNLWPLKRLTIKQCQAAVESLDLTIPGWDALLYLPDGIMNHDLIESTFIEALKDVAPAAFRKRT